jgi:flavin reductase
MTRFVIASTTTDGTNLRETAQDVFGRAMRRVASTVHVLTTLHDGRRFGLAATAVCSLSADPPSLLVCVKRASEAHDAIVASRRICINVLGEGQRAVAARFSDAFGDKAEQRFVGAAWYALATGAPALVDAAAVFDCRVFGSTEYKTHSVLTCLIEAVDLGVASAPLIYADQKYARVRREPVE